MKMTSKRTLLSPTSVIYPWTYGCHSKNNFFRVASRLASYLFTNLLSHYHSSLSVKLRSPKFLNILLKHPHEKAAAIVASTTSLSFDSPYTSHRASTRPSTR
jgi:hypothetical protein